MHNGGGAYGHGAMYPPPPPPPRGNEFGRGDGYGYYGGGYGGHPAQGYGGGMGMGPAGYGTAGVGPSSVLEEQLLGTYGGRLQNNSVRPAPYAGGGGYDDLPFGRGASGFGAYDGMDRFAGAGAVRGVGGLGMGMSNGGAAGVGVGGFEFDDASPQFPAASDILRGDIYGITSTTSASRANGNGTIGSGPAAVRGEDELPGLFSSFRAPGAAAGAGAGAGTAGAYASRYT
jgi:hypothetical protein